MHEAKIEAEIKMRRELNKRICYSKLEKLTQIYGNNFAVRLKAYARFFVEIDRLEQEEAKSDLKDECKLDKLLAKGS